MLTSDANGVASWAAAAGGSSMTLITTTHSAVAGSLIMADTNGGAFTITLPASPSTGDFIEIQDIRGTFATNKLTLGRNGSNIMGLAENLQLDISNIKVKIIYHAPTNDWRIY